MNQSSNYIIVGFNHKTAPIQVRERFAISEQALPALLQKIKNEVPGFSETAVLSTCNRFEVYGVHDADPEKSQAHLHHMVFQSDQNIPATCLYHYEDQEAVKHLFSVAASLDSLVIGENQIIKQVREAFEMAHQKQTTGPHLNRLFHRALYVAKRIKTETGVGQGQVSVGSVAVLLAKKIFGHLDQKRILLVGAGEIGTLVLRHLRDSGQAKETHIINRHFAKAQELAAAGLGRAYDFSELETQLTQADIVITSLTGFEPYFTTTLMTKINEARLGRTLFMIDLGVPRNIAEAVGGLANVYLYNIDDLKNIAEENRKSRQGQVVRAQDIVSEEAKNFYNEHFQGVLPTISGLNQKFEEIRKTEWNKSWPKLKHLAESDQKSIQQLTKSLVNKILQDPILLLKQEKALAEPRYLSVIKKIFRLDDEGENEF